MASDNAILKCVQLIEGAKFIAALTGAGISTKAGIPDFRGPQGLYVTRRCDPDKVFDIRYFCEDPLPFFQFARDFIGLEKSMKPTFTHKFLSDLEKKGKLKGVITQNIDSLHQMAGSRNVYEMHGSLWTSRCLKCGNEFTFSQMKKKLAVEEIPCCGCGGVIKPDVVFFGESVKYLEESENLAAASDLFFIIGTSCVVYPAAAIPQCTSGKIVVINRTPVDLPLDNVVLSVQADSDHFLREVAMRLENHSRFDIRELKGKISFHKRKGGCHEKSF